MKKIKTSITLDAELIEKLKMAAKTERRSVSQLITICLEDLVAEIENSSAPTGAETGG